MTRDGREDDDDEDDDRGRGATFVSLPHTFGACWTALGRESGEKRETGKIETTTTQQSLEPVMTIMNTIPVTGAQLVRPLAVMPAGATMTPTMTPLVPSPLAMNAAMDPVSFQQWWQAVSQLGGSRPGTPLAAGLNTQIPFPRMASPTMEQMQQRQTQSNAASAGGATTKNEKSASGKKSAKSSASRSPTPASVIPGVGNMPLKASRHKYAEQRRRNRINERLDHLRTLVPHTEGSNIAGFLDQVIVYVQALQGRMSRKDLEIAAEELLGEEATLSPEEGAEAGAKRKAEAKTSAGAEKEAQAATKGAKKDADRPNKKAKRSSK